MTCWLNFQRWMLQVSATPNLSVNSIHAKKRAVLTSRSWNLIHCFRMWSTTTMTPSWAAGLWPICLTWADQKWWKSLTSVNCQPTHSRSSTPSQILSGPSQCFRSYANYLWGPSLSNRRLVTGDYNYFQWWQRLLRLFLDISKKKLKQIFQKTQTNNSKTQYLAN